MAENDTVTLSKERIAYLEALVAQARTASAVFTSSPRKTSTASSSPWSWLDWHRPNILAAWQLKKPDSG